MADQILSLKDISLKSEAIITSVSSFSNPGNTTSTGFWLDDRGHMATVLDVQHNPFPDGYVAVGNITDIKPNPVMTLKRFTLFRSAEPIVYNGDTGISILVAAGNTTPKSMVINTSNKGSTTEVGRQYFGPSELSTSPSLQGDTVFIAAADQEVEGPSVFTDVGHVTRVGSGPEIPMHYTDVIYTDISFKKSYRGAPLLDDTGRVTGIVSDFDHRQVIAIPSKYLHDLVYSQLPIVYVNTSLQLNRTGRFSESLTAAREAVTEKPDDVRAWNNVGAALNDLHRWDEAIDAENTAIRIEEHKQQPDLDLVSLVYRNWLWSNRMKRRDNRRRTMLK